jgi:hypothetical protein
MQTTPACLFCIACFLVLLNQTITQGLIPVVIFLFNVILKGLAYSDLLNDDVISKSARLEEEDMVARVNMNLQFFSHDRATPRIQDLKDLEKANENREFTTEEKEKNSPRINRLLLVAFVCLFFAELSHQDLDMLHTLLFQSRDDMRPNLLDLDRIQRTKHEVMKLHELFNNAVVGMVTAESNGNGNKWGVIDNLVADTMSLDTFTRLKPLFEMIIDEVVRAIFHTYMPLVVVIACQRFATM